MNLIMRIVLFFLRLKQHRKDSVDVETMAIQEQMEMVAKVVRNKVVPQQQNPNLMSRPYDGYCSG